MVRYYLSILAAIMTLGVSHIGSVDHPQDALVVASVFFQELSR
jgi:hypothetical protein